MMLARRRWLTVGLAATLCVTASTVLTASAADTGSVFVPIAPVRVLDTRIGAGLSAALVSDTPATLRVTGTVAVVLPGDVVGSAAPVPTTATGIVANVTAVTPTTIGYLSVRPGTATGTPTTSTINFLTPGDIVPNSAGVELPTEGPAAGTIDVWFHGTAPDATTHVLIDIVGYYAPGSGSPGPAGQDGATGPAGPAGKDGAIGPVGPAGPTNRISDEQIALLQWYEDPGRPAIQIPTGLVPQDVAFDGAFIWVANYVGGTVVKIDPTTNAVIATVAVSSPWDLVFDGIDMWVTRTSGGGQITRIDVETATAVNTYPAIANPFSATFDGAHLWVAGYGSDQVVRIAPATGSIVGSPIAVGDAPQSLLFDGRYVWTANANDDTLSKIDAASATVVGTVAVGSRPNGLAFDGTYLWVAHWSGGDVRTYDPATGSPVGATITPVPLGESIAYDGHFMWVANWSNNTVTKIDATTHQIVATLDAADGIGTQPIAIAYDGSNIWVANYNGGGPGSVTKLVAG